MATTTNIGLTLLDVGQKEKEATINTNMSLLDTKVLKYLGEATADPATTGVIAGSTYYNSTALKLKVLKSTGTWVNVA
jgi:hypothetical protein